MSDSEEAGGDKSLTSLLDVVEYIISLFRAPLEAKGMCAASVQDELEDVVDFARKYLPLGTLGYRNIWFKLHTCPDSERWPNVRLLSELLFSLPITTSRVEQIFSRLKNIKTKLRSSLDTSTLQDLLEIVLRVHLFRTLPSILPLSLGGRTAVRLAGQIRVSGKTIGLGHRHQILLRLMMLEKVQGHPFCWMIGMTCLTYRYNYNT